MSLMRGWDHHREKLHSEEDRVDSRRSGSIPGFATVWSLLLLFCHSLPRPRPCHSVVRSLED